MFRIVVYEVKPPENGQRVERLTERYRQTVDAIDILQFAAAINRTPRKTRAKSAPSSS